MIPMPNRPKTIFLVVGIASAAFVSIKFAVPYFSYLLSSSLPGLWKSFLACFGTPHLFIAVNTIIIVVWKLHAAQHHHDNRDEEDDNSKLFRTSSTDSHPLPSELVVDLDSSPVINEVESSELSGSLEINKSSVDQVLGSDPWPPPEITLEEDHDSMDATWKAIISGKSSPNSKKNLKKSDTWERTEAAMPPLARSSAETVRRFGKSDTFWEPAKVAPKKEMRKSETFRESSSTGWRRRERLVIGQDELFSEAEAFIKMNYDQMRVRRQEVNAAY